MSTPQGPFIAECIVAIDGDVPNAAWQECAAPAATVVAADGGARHMRAVGRHVDFVVGDLDSLDTEEVRAIVEAGGRVRQHPRHKDETDFELALEFACSRKSIATLLVVGGSGGRVDHYAANLAVLSGTLARTVLVRAVMGDTFVSVTRPGTPTELSGTPGALVTLLAMHGTAGRVTTHGLTYPLDHEDLTAGSARGISNVMESSVASVSIETGVLLAFQPDHFPNQQNPNRQRDFS